MKRLIRICLVYVLLILIVVFNNIVNRNEIAINDDSNRDKTTREEVFEISSEEYLESLNATNIIIHEDIEYEAMGGGCYKPLDKSGFVDLGQLAKICNEYRNHKIILYIPKDIEMIATPSDIVVTTNSDEVPISISFGSLKDMYERKFEFDYYMKFRLGRTEGGSKDKTDFFKDSRLRIHYQNVLLNGQKISEVKIGQLVHSTSDVIHIEYLIESEFDSYCLEIKGDAQYSDLIKDIIGSYQIKNLLGTRCHVAVLYREDLLPVLDNK